MSRDRKIPARPGRRGVRGQASERRLYDRVTGSRRKISLGLYGSQESRQRYDQVIAEWMAAGRRLAAEPDVPRTAMMADEPDRVGWCRKTAARQTGRVIAIFRWAAAYQLLPHSIWESLRCLEPLRRGSGREHDPIRPAPDDAVAAVRRVVSSPVRTLIDLQLLTGARPGELLAMRAGDVERGRGTWLFRPADHKTAHTGKTREIPLGPRARRLLAPMIENLPPLSPVFPGYSVDSYRRAISRACVRAGVDHWHPHQLRHSALTRLRREHGAEAARVIAGHTDIDTTLIYAERDSSLAKKVARISG